MSSDPVSETKSREYDWQQLVKEAEAKEPVPFVHIAYRFSTGRTFKEVDIGLYDV